MLYVQIIFKILNTSIVYIFLLYTNTVCFLLQYIYLINSDTMYSTDSDNKN